MSVDIAGTCDPRFEKVRLDALGRDGKPYSLVASGFHARVIQHECDHLDGHVYLDQMMDMKTLGFLDEMQRFSGPSARSFTPPSE